MPTLSASLTTASLTALFGIVVFVLGQITVKFFLDPIQEQAKTIGGITHALTYYANVIDIATPEHKVEASRVYRDLSAGLLTSVRVIPFYGVLEKWRIVRTQDQIREASNALIGLSNTVGTDRYEDTEMRRKTIRESLGIKP